MKVLLLAFLFLGAGSPALAYDSESESESYFNDVEVQLMTTIRPCQSWRYSREAGGHVCSFPGQSVRVPDEFDYRSLKAKVRELEDRIRNLEAQN